MSGTGMEQARRVARGARRREGEKPWGRNVTGVVGSAGGRWLLAIETLEGNKPRKGRDSATP
jgi:hypothetical protein